MYASEMPCSCVISSRSRSEEAPSFCVFLPYCAVASASSTGDVCSGSWSCENALAGSRKSCLPKRPSAFEFEVVGLGSVTVMPALSHARIWLTRSK